MPNGYYKNWDRICGAIDGFRARFGTWPTKLILDQIIYEDLRGLFSEESLEVFEKKISLEAVDELTVKAEDDEGRCYDYVKCGFSREKPEIPAREWLGIRPDRDYH